MDNQKTKTRMLVTKTSPIEHRNLNKTMKVKHNLTQELLKEILTYDKETGQFQYLKYRNLKMVGNGRIINPKKTFVMIAGVHYTKGELAWLYVLGNAPSRRVMHHNKDRADSRWENLRLTYEEKDRRTRTPEPQLTHEEVITAVHYNPLTGDFIRVDGETPETAQSWNKWDRCWTVTIKGVKFLAHRLAWFIMEEEWSKHNICHTDRAKNGRSNNKWRNLYADLSCLRAGRKS